MNNLPVGSSGREPMDVAVEAVSRAGDIIMAHFGTDMSIDYKGRGNIATEVDYLVEATILEFLRREFPDFSTISEESPAIDRDSEYTWVLDPVDGSKNFSAGMPIFCVNLALARGEELLLALTYDPTRGELFSAEKGGGTYLNGRRARVSTRATLRDSVIGFDMGYSDERARQALKLMLGLWPGVQSIRIIGSAALGLAYAACGRLDIYFHHLLSPWDLAPGILLVQEAGGVITERDGGPISINSEGLIASSKAIHADFMKLSKDYPWQG